MDAAAAAAMSDPLMNRWFRRRWTERAEDLPVPVFTIDRDADFAIVGRELLAAWRRERGSRRDGHASATGA